MNDDILVVGCGTGIGQEVTTQLEGMGKKVIGTSRSERNNVANFYTLDVLDPSSFPDLQNPLSGIVYCPGSITLKPFRSLKDEDFLKEFELNLLGFVRVIRKYLPNLLEATDASVVSFSTVAAQLGLPYHTSIAASKGAMESLIKSLAAEFAPKIRFNGIAPSLTDTPLAKSLLDSETKRKTSEDRHPLKQVGNPKDIASLAIWLLSESSKFTTGQIFGINGGLGNIRPN
ncbi:MAG: SDR family NAD(P)-dependent oxidoreductase [Leptospira sp.]|nr:SDR family NAD(P)-dependent oxidoreductase [Leptospira sp.]